jgi:hypothetical protein
MAGFTKFFTTILKRQSNREWAFSLFFFETTKQTVGRAPFCLTSNRNANSHHSNCYLLPEIIAPLVLMG